MQELADLGGLSFGAGFKEHECPDLFAHHRIWDAHYRALVHGRMSAQRVLHFDAVDIFSAAVDHVLFAVDDLDEAVFVYAREVSGVQPAIYESLRGRLGLVPVTFHDIRPAHQQFADAAGIRLKKIEIHNRSGKAHRIGPDVRELVWQERGNRGSLGQSEAVADTRIRECLHDTPHQIRSDRSAAVHRPADALYIDVTEIGLVDREPENGRHGSDRVDALLIDGTQ